MEYMLSDVYANGIVTVHVKNNLSRTIEFYKNIGFMEYKCDQRFSQILNNWVDRCKGFDSATYNNKKLLYRISNSCDCTLLNTFK